MSIPHRVRGVKVLKAVSSPLRLQILNLLFDKAALSYTELMNALKMNPSRDAGRFAYHLKFLLRADLVEADAEAKKYCLTDLGKMVIDVADRVEKKAVKPKGMLVRTSHFTFEEFDANKIASSLIREARMPVDLAQKTSKEAEKLLLKAKTKYLTAPLIREIVNVILIEKGLEEYRHKLTRLGLPVHEVTALIEAKEEDETSEPVLSTAGKTVFREYTLLNVFPRDIADAHVSGALHINRLSTWILKPNEVIHDLRFFLQNGLKLGNRTQRLSMKPPGSFEAALSMAFNVLLLSCGEVNETQTYEYFNVFLAPYARGVDAAILKENLRLFILNVNHHVSATLGLDLRIPKHIAGMPAVGPQGKTVGTCGDFAEESRLLASLILETCAEESLTKPLHNPKLIVKINNETLTDDNSRKLLLKAHSLAAERGNAYFANTLRTEGKNAAFSTTGVKLEADLSTDWETDTLRTGCLGYVTVNMPRTVREAEGDKTKLISLLKERCELAARAMGIKHKALRQYGRSTLPFLMQSTNGDTYFRLENCSSIINLAGFHEAVETFTGKALSQPESLKLAQEITQEATSYLHKMGRRHGKRLFLSTLHSAEASTRLAQLDIEKYGVAKVRFQGTRESPFYSTTRRVPLQAGSPLAVSAEFLDAEERLKGLGMGGSLVVVELNGVEDKPEELLDLTAGLMQNQGFEFLTYNRRVTYCAHCEKSWLNDLHKCPVCGSIGTLVVFDRFGST
ncbi:MAG: anaerobic ribonucleoside-triphosphate reductase [Candidatus Bathyarchaeia archaeon]